MEVKRGDVWWVDLAEPRGSGPGYRRPLLVVQADAFNRSRLDTIVAVALTSNIRLADAPGNVVVPRRASGLPRDSVANVTQLVTVDRDGLDARAGNLPTDLMRAVDAGLRLALGLGTG